MENSKKNTLWILCIVGGSGAGKTSAIRRLIKKYSNMLYFSISATTKTLSKEEIDTLAYYFYSLRQFNEAEKKGLFIETNPFSTGHRYGTLLSELEYAQKEGKVLVVDCEFNGAINIYKKYPENTACLFLDVSDEEAEKRLMNSTTRKRDSIPQRIKNLREQRIFAKTSDVFKVFFDTTGIEENIVFSVVEGFFIEEFNMRKSLVSN